MRDNHTLQLRENRDKLNTGTGRFLQRGETGTGTVSLSAAEECTVTEGGVASGFLPVGAVGVTIGVLMSFHLGKPILVMLILAVVCAAGLALRPGKRRDGADLVVWVFAEVHQKTYAGDG